MVFVKYDNKYDDYDVPVTFCINKQVPKWYSLNITISKTILMVIPDGKNIKNDQ